MVTTWFTGYGLLSYACLKEVWFRNSNYKLQIYAIYDYLQIILCSRFD